MPVVTTGETVLANVPPAQPATAAHPVPALAAEIYAAHHAAAATRTLAPKTITVAEGDTLSSLAQRYLGKASQWPALWWANRHQVDNPSLILPGQKLTLPVAVTVSVKLARAARAEIPAPPPPPPAPVTVAAAPAPAPVPAPAPQSYGGAPGSFQACVIARESGGNAQVMNSTGHYGLYQFSSSTWAAYGGNLADFGNASVAEQTQVFNNAMATPGGASNWSPYDGC